MLLLVLACGVEAPLLVPGPREELALGAPAIARQGGDAAVAVDAWSRPVPHGVEQGWDVYDRPDGEGLLVVDVPVTGGRTTGGGDAVYLHGDGGGLWRIDGLAAWDTTGRALPATLAATSRGYAVHVDDTGAAYPVSIDPIVASIGLDLGEIGAVQSLAADFNGDGADDLVVSPWLAPPEVWPGGPSGPTAGTALDEPAGLDFTGADADDLNGDGYDDLALGWYSSGRQEGEIAVHYGGPGGLAAAPDVTLHDLDNPSFGSVISVGDIDGDGFADVASTGNGGWSVFAGSAAGVPDTPSAGRHLDTRYSAGRLDLHGDFDGDGDADLAYGAWGSAHSDGTVLLFRGSPAGLGGRARRLYAPGGAGSAGYFGYTLSTGDVNGDGYDDLFVGARDEPGGGGAYVYAGSAHGVQVDPVFSDHGTGGVYTGLVADVLGDGDGDGDDELVLGEYDRAIAGQVRVFAGGATGPTEVYSLTGLDLGYSSACTYPYVFGGRKVGDVNGDGFADLAVMTTISLDGSCAGGGYAGGVALLWGAG